MHRNLIPSKWDSSIYSCVPEKNNKWSFALNSTHGTSSLLCAMKQWFLFIHIQTHCVDVWMCGIHPFQTQIHFLFCFVGTFFHTKQNVILLGQSRIQVTAFVLFQYFKPAIEHKVYWYRTETLRLRFSYCGMYATISLPCVKYRNLRTIAHAAKVLLLLFFSIVRVDRK